MRGVKLFYMIVSPVFFFVIIASVIVLSLALLAMAVSYYHVLKKLLHREEKLDELFQEVNEKGKDLLEHTRKKSSHVIEEATKKAKELIADSQSLSIDSKKVLDEALSDLIKNQVASFQKASEDFLKEYKNELEMLRSNTVQVARNVSKDIEDDAVREVDNYRQVLQKETIDSQKIVEAKIEEDYAKTQKEVTAYREKMLKEVDEDIYKILETVSKEAIGKSIPLAQHEQLIIDALEKAKKSS